MQPRPRACSRPNYPAMAATARVAPAPGRMLVTFAPVLALAAATVLLAGAAWSGWFTREMHAAAQVAGAAAGILAMVLLYRQIRQRQASGLALQSVTARVGDIVEAAMDPIVTVDAAQRIVLFNAAAEKVFGWPREAVWVNRWKSSSRSGFATGTVSISMASPTGATTRRMGGQTILAGLRANGEEFPIDASISQHSEDGRQLFTVILRDIGERLEREALLARGEARMRGILDSAMDAIITVDRSQHIVLFNAAAEALFGCPRGEAIGVPLAWFIPERFRGAHTEHVRRFGETGTASRRMGALRVVTGLRRNGEEFPIDASISQRRRGRQQVLHGDSSRRLRARAHRRGIAGVQGGAAQSRGGRQPGAGAGAEPACA